MAVVTVAAVDATPIPTRWETPPDYIGNRSPVPRGIDTFAGEDAIATLSAGDETAYTLALTMPTGFAYLPRNIMLRFGSSDLVNNFGNQGVGIYTRAKPAMASGRDARFNITSPGEAILSAVVAERMWVPGRGAQKLLLAGGDILTLAVSDMDAGGSSAGTMRYWLEFYVFDVDQVDKFEVNTPIPTISHTSF